MALMRIPSEMSSEDLVTSLSKLRITQRDLAMAIDYSPEQVNAMCRGRTPVRKHVEILIDLMLEVPGIRERIFPWKPATGIKYAYEQQMEEA